VRIEGKKVALVSLEECDLHELWELAYGVENPEWKEWDAPYFPFERLSYEDYCEHIDRVLSTGDPVPHRVAITTRDGQLIGTVSYYWEHKESLWLEAGIAIYNPRFWNGGYGTEALRLWVDHLFRFIPLVRAGLTTWSGNVRMIRAAEKVGMQMEARIRKVRLYNGVFYDSIRMGVLREEWQDRMHLMKGYPWM